MQPSPAQQRNAKLQLICSMLIFGTIGVFRNHIALPSGMIACVRGICGALFLVLLVRLRGMRFSGEAIRRNIGLLVFSGVLIGFNWILLFEAYRYTSLAVATFAYYMAPVFVIVISALLFRQGFSLGRALCVLLAMLGMVFVSGVLETGLPTVHELRGIGFGLAAALLYAVIVLLNSKLTQIGPYDRTVVQLAAAGLALVPYVLLAEDWSAVHPDILSILLLIVVALFHTGFAYAMYFGSMAFLPVQTVALFSYIDPMTAILLAAILPEESFTLFGAIGAALILGSTLLNEFLEKRQRIN